MRFRVLRTMRRLGFHRSELRRPLDRAQSVVALGLLLVFVALGPLAAARTGQRVYDSEAEHARQQTATRHQVDAVVVARLPAEHKRSTAESSISGDVVGGRSRLQWRAPDGSPRTGTAHTSRPVGTHLKVWVDDSWAIAGMPQTRVQTIGTTAFAVAGALAAVGLPLALGQMLMRRRFDRRRLADWEAEWSRIAPRWTGRH